MQIPLLATVICIRLAYFALDNLSGTGFLTAIYQLFPHLHPSVKSTANIGAVPCFFCRQLNHLRFI